MDVNHGGGTSGEMDLMIARFRSLTQGTSGNGAGNAKSEDWKNLKVTKFIWGAIRYSFYRCSKKYSCGISHARLYLNTCLTQT